jgi:hypothetical protein
VVAVLLLLGPQCSRNSAFSERAGNINCIGHRTLASGPRPTSAGQFSWKQATVEVHAISAIAAICECSQCHNERKPL